MAGVLPTRRKRGALTIDELGRWARHRESRDLSIMYMGYALKPRD